MNLQHDFPPRDEILAMSPEELAPLILSYLRKNASNSGEMNRYNFSLNFGNDGALATVFMEAWMWLENEGFLAPKPGDSSSEWRFITRKGKVADVADFAAYLKGAAFPGDLDSALTAAVRPIFIRGDYDTAVFRAFKEVEVRVRSKGNLGNELIGRNLMNIALGPNGPLRVSGGHKDDQSAVRELFAGAISACKNPSSHHEVQFQDPREALDMICFANHLLRIVDRLEIATV